MIGHMDGLHHIRNGVEHRKVKTPMQAFAMRYQLLQEEKVDVMYRK